MIMITFLGTYNKMECTSLCNTEEEQELSSRCQGKYRTYIDHSKTFGRFKIKVFT